MAPDLEYHIKLMPLKRFTDQTSSYQTGNVSYLNVGARFSSSPCDPIVCIGALEKSRNTSSWECSVSFQRTLLVLELRARVGWRIRTDQLSKGSSRERPKLLPKDCSIEVVPPHRYIVEPTC